jgi:hypothetical protein
VDLLRDRRVAQPFSVQIEKTLQCSPVSDAPFLESRPLIWDKFEASFDRVAEGVGIQASK